MAGFLGGLIKGIGKGLSGGGLGTALSIGSGLLGLIGAGKQKRQGKKMLAGLQDPGYVIPDEFKKNVGEAENMARVGLPSEQYNLATTNIQRGTQAGLRQLGRMSNPFAGISSIQRNQNDALAGLDAQNAAARRQNMMGAMNARSAMAGQKLAQQQYAQQGYADQYNQAMSMIGAGQQNRAGALGALGQFGMMKSIYGGGGSGGGGLNKNITTGASLPSTSVLNNPGVGQYKPTKINWNQQSAPYAGPIPSRGNIGLFGFPGE